MSIKKIADARPLHQPTQALQNYKQHGLGHDTEPAPRGDTAPTTRTTVVMPSDLHRKFKSLCAEKGKPMGAEIVRLMASWVDD